MSKVSWKNNRQQIALFPLINFCSFLTFDIQSNSKWNISQCWQYFLNPVLTEFTQLSFLVIIFHWAMKELVEYCIWSTSASVFMFCSSTGSGDICPLYETIQPNYLSKDLPVDWPLSWPDLPPTAQQASYVSHNTVWYIAVICPQWLEFKRFHEGVAKTFGVWLLRKCVAICWIHHPVIGLMRSESSPSLCILEFAEPWQSQLKVLPIWPWWIIFRHV